MFLKSKIAFFSALGVLVIGLVIYALSTGLFRAVPALDIDSYPASSQEAPNSSYNARVESPPLKTALPEQAKTHEDEQDGLSNQVSSTTEENSYSNSQTGDNQQTATPKSSPDEAKINLEIGQILQFGNYYGKPINWRVIHIDNNGHPLLLASEILSLKAFDASESGIYNKIGDLTFDNKKPKEDVYKDYSQEDMRKMKGSNSWADSNIRFWLNSDQKSVSFVSQPPNDSAVWGGMNSYEKERGFLYNFSDQEKSIIRKVKHKSVISLMEKDTATGGNALYSFSRASLDDVWFNLNDAYYTDIEDKIFLLSVEEALNYIYDRGELLKAYPTAEAVERDESNWYNELRHQSEGSFMWWLRTPNANTSCEVCIVGTTGDLIYSDYAVLSGVGVRPACWLDSSELVLSGAGTKEAPYTLN